MRILLLALLLTLNWSGGALRAQTCTVATLPVAFGVYQPLGGPAVTTTGTVTVTCVASVSLFVSYTAKLGAGSSGNIAARSMGGPSPPLPYQLYRDNGFSQVWGDGTGGSFYITGGYLLAVLVPVTNNYTVYGKIPANQPASVGAYTDAVTVLLTY